MLGHLLQVDKECACSYQGIKEAASKSKVCTSSGSKSSRSVLQSPQESRILFFLLMELVLINRTPEMYWFSALGQDHSRNGTWSLLSTEREENEMFQYLRTGPLCQIRGYFLLWVSDNPPTSIGFITAEVYLFLNFITSHQWSWWTLGVWAPCIIQGPSLSPRGDFDFFWNSASQQNFVWCWKYFILPCPIWWPLRTCGSGAF